MDPLLIVLLGTAVMVVGLMGFRLPAFLALILAAFVVCVLTPAPVRQGQALKGVARLVTLLVESGKTTVSPVPSGFRPLGAVVLFERDSQGVHLVAEGRLGENGGKPLSYEFAGGANLAVVRSELWLVPASVWAQGLERSRAHPMDLVTEGFGSTCASIGLLIILASIIGECLTASGAAGRIVQWIQTTLGECRAPHALASSAFFLGIPVFFDTVFYLLMPLGRGLAVRTGRNFLLYTLSIVAGATMAHSLVPPTPGPLMVANELGVSLGLMMIGGTVVGLIAATAGFAYATWADRRWDVAPPAEESATATTASITSEPDQSTLPPLWLAIAPIVLPVMLIGGAAALDLLPAAMAQTWWGSQLVFWGDKNISLGLSAALALVTFWWFRRVPLKQLSAATQTALASAGVIILITSAGGSFGAVLQQTGIAEVLTAMMPASKAALLPIAFLLTATIRIAQGSATVAMITAVGIVGPLVLAGDLGYHPLYVALAIGCGSKPIPWMNDSGFWIIGKMAGFSEIQTLKTASAMMTLMGVVGLIVTMLGAWLLPLV